MERTPCSCPLCSLLSLVTGVTIPRLMDFKGQLISKANCQAVSSSKKQTNEFVFTTMRSVFVCFFEEIEDTKKNLSK